MYRVFGRFKYVQPAALMSSEEWRKLYQYNYSRRNNVELKAASHSQKEHAKYTVKNQITAATMEQKKVIDQPLQTTYTVGLSNEPASSRPEESKEHAKRIVKNQITAPTMEQKKVIDQSQQTTNTVGCSNEPASSSSEESKEHAKRTAGNQITAPMMEQKKVIDQPQQRTNTVVWSNEPASSRPEESKEHAKRTAGNQIKLPMMKDIKIVRRPTQCQFELMMRQIIKVKEQLQKKNKEATNKNKGKVQSEVLRRIIKPIR